MVHIETAVEGRGITNEEDRQRLPVFFYRTEAGHEPVREWLKELDPDERKAIGTDLLRVQEQWPIGMPVRKSKSLGKGLWEVRTGLPSNRTARVLSFVHERRIGVVHGFIKKTQKTPVADLELARKRMKEMRA
jgi:phage-related protein